MRAILKKSWRQHPTKQQLYGHLPPITKTIKVRWTRHSGHCWRSKDELIRDILRWTLSHGRAKAGQLARTYIQQHCTDTGCRTEGLPEAMDDRKGRRERVWDICADGVTWWYIYIYIYICVSVSVCVCVYFCCKSLFQQDLLMTAKYFFIKIFTCFSYIGIKVIEKVSQPSICIKKWKRKHKQNSI